MKKYNIAILHYIANFTDGVSLEMNKWRQVFETMGHTVHLVAGQFGSDEEVLIPEIFHHTPEAHRLTANTFKALVDYPDEADYRAELYQLAGVIYEKLSSFVEEKKINFLVPQNVWSVAVNPAVAIALTNIMRKYQVPALAHNHDFYFERTDGYALTCGTAAELADCYLPPRDPLAKHVVINSIGQRKLLERKGISSTVVPNVFDFDSPPWAVDEYNQDFREQIGLRQNDVLVLQATRIVTRKGIELAIDFVEALNEPERRAALQSKGLFDGRRFEDENRIVLVLAGYSRDDVTGRYKDLLAEKAKASGVEALFIEAMVDESRDTRNGRKIYSLWDTYAHADFITYPSLWEGWGNQLLEALRAKVPVMLFEYPVYQADIKAVGLKAVSIGDQITGRDENGLAQVAPEVIASAADQAVVLLTDAGERETFVAHNFQVGRQYFSMDALAGHLERLMTSFENR
jgi:glycosyltransferase involved in cell wall biosynthesis